MLSDKECIPCKGGVPPLGADAIAKYRAELNAEWEVIDEHHLSREFAFKDFAEALAFTNRVGAMAEEQNHHPDIQLSWGKVKLVIWTHDAGGLTQNDFVWAAKADQRLAE